MKYAFGTKIGAVDLNIYGPDEPEFKGGELTKSGIDLFVQEIQLLFDTKRGDVLGSDYGTDLRDIIFQQNASAQLIQQEIFRLLDKFVDSVNYYNVEVEVKFLKGRLRDICLIDFTIVPKITEDETFRFSYVFS